MMMFRGHWRRDWGLLCCEGFVHSPVSGLFPFWRSGEGGGGGDGDGGVCEVDVGNPTSPRMHAWMQLNPVLFLFRV